MQRLALMMAVMMLGMPPVNGYNTSVDPGSQGVGGQAEMMFPPSAWFGNSREALATEKKVSSATLDGNPPVEPGGFSVRRILQQVQQGMEGLAKIKEEARETQQKEDEGEDPTHEVLERLAADISKHWLGNYAGLESLPGIVVTAMMGVSAAEMVISTAVRMSVLYAWKGPGPWMAAAVWGTAFQMITMPGRWALEWGRTKVK
jgi:hypothetical protein